jgi:hypothetical protein
MPHPHSAARPRTLGLLAALILVLAACSPTSYAETPFVRQASDAASLLSAAATTIEYLHDDKLDTRYASPSLQIYRDMLKKIAPTLAGQRGAPDDATLQPVLDKLDAAQQALDEPCLADDCDWQAQLDTLRQAQDALTGVSE